MYALKRESGSTPKLAKISAVRKANCEKKDDELLGKWWMAEVVNFKIIHVLTGLIPTTRHVMPYLTYSVSGKYKM